MSNLKHRNPFSSVKSAAEHYWRIGLEPMPLAADFERLLAMASEPANWSHELIDQKFGETDNVGLILGPTSGDLIEVDFHWQETRQEALELMQDLPAFYRDGAGYANYFARTKLRTGPVQFKIPESLSHMFGAGQRIILELKGDGYQALVPLSLHPSGARLGWRSALTHTDDFPNVSPEWLIAKAGLIAAMAVPHRACPSDHSNKDNILPEITGFLLNFGCESHFVNSFLYPRFFNASQWNWQSHMDEIHAVKARMDAGERIGDINVVCQLLGIEPMARNASKLA